MKERSMTTQAGFKGKSDTVFCEPEQKTVKGCKQEKQALRARRIMVHLNAKTPTNIPLKLIAN
jgi:hypothetical protein